MSDRDLRTLERLARENRDDANAWARYVRALDLAGTAAPADLAELVARVRVCLGDAPSQALIQEGDEVWVTEHDTPYIVGRWRGVVKKVYFERDELTGKLVIRFRVWPSGLADEEPTIPWRIRPMAHWRVHGLELGKDDRLELIARAGSTPPPPVK